ncbi:MAG: terminase large subunit [Bacteroidales bacterium]|nr:terminase large subunit [Bacteroidales bacterium]
MTRNDQILEGVAAWCAYYRSNPHRFAHDYLHLNLHLFQKILLVMMNRSSIFVFIGCRGIGKSFLSAVFCVIRCILYPGTKICIASGTRGQAMNVLEKIILELKSISPELSAEIDEKETKTNGTNAQIVFKNTSYIKVVTSSDSARGNRANLLLLDEFRMISKDVIDTIFRKFLTLKRSPEYRELSKEERIKKITEEEKNQTIYLSSAYFVDHWSYLKCTDTCKAMLDDTKRQFVCGLPYQLSIREGLLDTETVEDEMAETDFSEIKFQMEYSAIWYGNTDGSFFDYNSISKNRTIKYPMLPEKLASKLSNSSKVKIPPKVPGELRILSADIALMPSSKHNNDATAIFINQLTLTKAGRYMSNIVFADTYEGLRTDDQALVIRKFYDEFDCDYIVLDTNGIGLGVYDCLVRDIVDSSTGEVYPAISCCNNSEMASRCTVMGADKVIWSVKASTQFNSDCAYMLREAFRSGRIRLLCTEYDAEEFLGDIRGYDSLSPADKVKIQMPYINTTLLVDELTKLRHEESGGKIKVYERSGMRKDRYSSLSYNYYVAMQLENKMSRRHKTSAVTSDMFIIRPPNYKGKAVSTSSGRGKKNSWN